MHLPPSTHSNYVAFISSCNVSRAKRRLSSMNGAIASALEQNDL